VKPEIWEQFVKLAHEQRPDIFTMLQQTLDAACEVDEKQIPSYMSLTSHGEAKQLWLQERYFEIVQTVLNSAGTGGDAGEVESRAAESAMEQILFAQTLGTDARSTSDARSLRESHAHT